MKKSLRSMRHPFFMLTASLFALSACTSTSLTTSLEGHYVEVLPADAAADDKLHLQTFDVTRLEALTSEGKTQWSVVDNAAADKGILIDDVNAEDYTYIFGDIDFNKVKCINSIMAFFCTAPVGTEIFDHYTLNTPYFAIYGERFIELAKQD